jgi:hypothetical protein
LSQPPDSDRRTAPASVRDPASLAKLPKAEREAWQKLWTDVASLADAAQQKKPPKP